MTLKCRMLNCEEDCFRLGVCAHHWSWLNGMTDIPVQEPIKLPSEAIFMRGQAPGPLSQEEREWLVEQLHQYPVRVNESRTCAIGALTDMATTEFCRLMAEKSAERGG